MKEGFTIHIKASESKEELIKRINAEFDQLREKVKKRNLKGE